MTNNVYDRGPSQYASGTVSGNVYTVAQGDTPYSISQRFGLPWKSICQANGLPENTTIHPGQKLIIPGLSSTLPVYDRGPSQYASGTVSGNIYTVASGDTPYSISQRFGLPWESIAQANGLSANTTIHPGQKLIIPGLN